MTSQLYVAEALTREVCAAHPEYSECGQPDTTNSTDAFFSGPEHVPETKLRPDGVLLAYETLVLRSSLDDELCGTDLLMGALQRRRRKRVTGRRESAGSMR
ncbi:MAG: hypothetical protein ABI895_24680 [Deltaproteobacteria bacterium]